MDNEKIIHRLYKYLEYKNIPKTRFEKQIGISNGYLNTQLKNDADLGEGVIMKIIAFCPELNFKWLITGKGEMFDDESSEILKLNPKSAKVYIVTEPLNAGFGNSYIIDDNNELKFFMYPFLPEGEYYMFKISGRSMEDYITEGSYVICRKVNNKYQLQDGKLFVVVTKSEGLTIKRVFFERERIILVSDNSFYKPFSMPHEEIKEYLTVESIIKTDFPINPYTVEAVNKWNSLEI